MTRFLLGAAIIIGAVVGARCGGGRNSTDVTKTASIAPTPPPIATATQSSAPTAALPTVTPTASPTQPSTPTAAPIRFEPTKADALAHASLVSATDLPGGDWTVAIRDDFSLSPPPTSPACAPMATAQKALEVALDTNRAGRARVELLKAGDQGTADFMVYIYQDSKAAETSLGAHRGMFDNDAFATCLAAETNDSSGVTARVTKMKPLARAPSGSMSAAFDLELSADDLPLGALHFEAYAWRNSNAFVSVNLSGPKNLITAELVTAAVGTLQAAVEAAASAR